MYLGDNDPLYASLREHFDRHQPKRSEELVSFAQKLYKLAPVKELAAEPVADLAGLIMSLRRYLDRLSGDGPKIRSFNPNLEEDGWEHRHTQVFVLQGDMAFLVDSVRMALTRHGLGIHSINSTVFDVVRDAEGHLLELPARATGASHKEALISFQVDHYSSAEQHERIIAEIADVLDCVAAVNRDYLACVDRLNQIIDTVRQVPLGLPQEELAENIAFLEWLRDNHFTFLAYSYYSISDEEDPLVTHLGERALGMFRHRPRDIAAVRVSELAPGFREFYGSHQVLTLAKSTTRSRVHRDAYSDYVIIKDLDASGKVVGEHRFQGLYTSLVYSQTPFNVPLIRLKLTRIMERSGLNPSGHYGKALRQIIEVHPREELLHGSEDQLFDILVGIWQINERRLVRLFMRPDPYEKFINCIVYFPRDSYRTEIREKAEQLLCSALAATESQFATFFTQSLLARTHFVMRIDSDAYRHVNVAELERKIAAFTNDWRDDLHQAIIEHWGDEEGLHKSEVYRDAFPVSYQSHFDPRSAVRDIALFDELADGQQIAMSFFQPQGAENGVMRFKIFHPGSELSLSRMVPMLENLGFQVIGEHPYQLAPAAREDIWVHDFTLKFSLDVAIDVPGVRQNFVDAFRAVWQGTVDDDSFNWLVIGARLDWRSVALIRLYARYMKQLRMTISQEFIAATLASNLDITRNLVALFKCCFDPKLAGQDGDKSDRSERSKRLESKILEALDGVANLNQDQVLRTYLQLICATVRTSFFQRDGEGQEKPYIAIKLTPRQLALVPEPRPEFEIFVYSPRFEGIHLRAGKIARGGIRWSDRLEDYRTEVLGLVKAQQVKNAVIVPTGAKGGFIVKRPPPGGSRSVLLEEARACYELFMGGLLDITDNIIAGEVAPPRDVIRRDGDDAYLVVAADKGTASFSDLANSVSARYGHWLGDAFASGGSQGYDHKKMGITARGAWVAVQRHFREQGVNIQEQEFTVMGIGDMSGDVFGNGMLLSPCIRLVAAFNHKSIFLDPSPDAATSFTERQRLFHLAGSSWEDYDASLISKGGGIYSRDTKAIALSPEVRELLGVEDRALSPNALIKRLLCAPVDLIWNGGIGTYVKGRGESHADAGDRASDELRVDGGELRCKVFGEGGNLGMTQRGRIEYALAGGACNTDFIDNSGGVDCSDQEVNIKIALIKLVADEDLTNKQRNAWLEEMTEEVAAKVLHHNYRQTQAISLARVKAADNLSEFWHCIGDWEAAGLLNRHLEYLPDDEVLAEREKSGQFLTRPELAILISYSKILFKQQLLVSDIGDDPYIAGEIHKAFPESLSQRSPQVLANHALRREVLCNLLANEVVDLMGVTFVHRQIKSTGADGGAVVRAYVTVRDVLDLESVWREVEALDHKQDSQLQARLHLSLMRLGRRATRWVIRNRRSCTNTGAEIDSLKPVINTLLAASVEQQQAVQHHQDSQIAELQEMGLSSYATMLIDSASDLFFAFGMADVAIRTGADIDLVSEIYSQLGELLQLEWFSEQIIALPSLTRWEDFARESFMDNLESQYRTLAVAMLSELGGGDELQIRLDHWQQSQQILVSRWRDMIGEMKGTTQRNYAMFSVALRELEDLVDTTQQQGGLAEFCAVPGAVGG